jgi:hypothetical protein
MGGTARICNTDSLPFHCSALIALDWLVIIQMPAISGIQNPERINQLSPIGWRFIMAASEHCTRLSNRLTKQIH